MDLFNTPSNSQTNLLPNDGIVNYYGVIIPIIDADLFYTALLKTIKWKPDEAVIFRKHILTKRKVAWYADTNFKYTYSGITKEALIWTKELLQLKNITEDVTGEKFNSCLLNLYHNGEEGMAWHSDGEKDLKKHGAIGSLSFGVQRKFSFKHKETKQKIDIQLAHGSLLVMRGATQSHWLHRLPPAKLISKPRINLTFRMIEK